MPSHAAAFFDVDGTLTRTTILHPLLWYLGVRQGRLRHLLGKAGLLLQLPRYLWIDRRSRARVNVVIYRRYAGLPADDISDWHRTPDAVRRLTDRLFPKARECVEEHRRLGRRVILVTGGLDAVMRPFAEHIGAADVLATRLAERDGVFTGAIDGPPIADERKAELVRAYAAEHGIDLAASFAYGDSVGDAAMLECVGHPVAVNAGRRLRRLAAQRHWPVVSWPPS